MEAAMRDIVLIVGLGVLLSACSGGGSDPDDNNNPPPVSSAATVLAANDLGMHCIDSEFSIFSILPPYNVVNAQVVRRDGSGRPYLADHTGVRVTFDAVADPAGSVNSFSLGKTNFWQYAGALFGMTLPAGEGLTGVYMPREQPYTNGPQLMPYHLLKAVFHAEGIPITPLDDDLESNPYPLMRIAAADAVNGAALGHLDVVVPVSAETDCRTCHKTGAMAADDSDISWSLAPDLEVQSKINILRLHDAEHQTSLEASQPVLCAGCHYSPALDLAGTGPAGGQIGNPNFSNVMHEFHGELEANSQPVFPPGGTVAQTCYQCHPGNVTQCQRGAMKTGGMDCRSCHGDMLAVGGSYALLTGGSIDGTNDGNDRRPWKDLPRCQSCHTGDALGYLAGSALVADPAWPFRLRQAYRTGDAAASPLLAANKRFAENTNSLYRASKGHGGILCEGCHGSTHAEWPNASATANDNLAAEMLQGHAGPVIECTTCHAPSSLARTTSGPHGLHNVNDSRWYDEGHEEFYENNKNGCKACHGANLTGTPLARVPVARSFSVEGKTFSYARGDMVRCDRCHGMPDL
jgi:hypothetical protein